MTRTRAEAVLRLPTAFGCGLFRNHNYFSISNRFRISRRCLFWQHTRDRVTNNFCRISVKTFSLASVLVRRETLVMAVVFVPIFVRKFQLCRIHYFYPIIIQNSWIKNVLFACHARVTQFARQAADGLSAGIKEMYFCSNLFHTLDKFT